MKLHGVMAAIRAELDRQSYLDSIRFQVWRYVLAAQWDRYTDEQLAAILSYPVADVIASRAQR